MADSADLLSGSNCGFPEIEDSDLDSETAEHMLADIYFGDGVDEDTLSVDGQSCDHDSVSGSGGDSLARSLSSVSEGSDCSEYLDDDRMLTSTESEDSEEESQDNTASHAEEKWDVDFRDATRGVQTGKGRYYSPKNVRCRNCDETGHVARECPNPKKRRPCFLCGVIGHMAEKCPEQVCYRCLRQGHQAKNCHNGGARPHDVCRRCFMQGHHASLCSDLWRQYHNTLDNKGSLVQDKPQTKRQFCYNCGRKGHWGHECAKRRMTFVPPTLPFVAFYRKRPSDTSARGSSFTDRESFKRRSNHSCEEGMNDLERTFEQPLSKKRRRDSTRYDHNGFSSSELVTPSKKQSHREQRGKHFKHSDKHFGSSKRYSPNDHQERHRQHNAGHVRKRTHKQSQQRWELNRHQSAPQTPVSFREKPQGIHRSAPPRHQNRQLHTASPSGHRSFGQDGKITIYHADRHTLSNRGFRISAKGENFRRHSFT